MGAETSRCTSMASGFGRGLGGMGAAGSPFQSGVAVAGLENCLTGFEPSLPGPSPPLQAAVRTMTNMVAPAMEHCHAIRATGAPQFPNLQITIVVLPSEHSLTAYP